MSGKTIIKWIPFIFVIFISMFKKIKNYVRAVLLALKMPGPPALPILGNVLAVKSDKDFFEIAENAAKQYPESIFRAWVFFLPAFFVYEPDDLKIILSSFKLSKKNIFYRVMHNFIGDGLVTSNDEKWRNKRKLIQPYFQVNLLENYFESIAVESEKMNKSLQGIEDVKITGYLNTCVLNILHKTVLGITLKPDVKTPFRGGELLVLKRVLKPWLLFDSVFKRSKMCQKEDKQSGDLHHYVKKVLEERIMLRKSGCIKEPCLLDALIELSETTNFSQQDLVDETVSFMLVGQDSVGSATAFCLYYIAKHQEVQEKIYQEIDELVYEDHLKTITIPQLNEMHYLEQCVKETLRLAPSIPMVSRVLNHDVTLGKYTIPAGANIFMPAFITHRLPQYFPNPSKFDPERFSQENMKKMHPFSFIPFSAGHRNCIGFKFAYIEIKTIVATLLKNYEISLPPGSEDLNFSYRVTLRAKKGIWLQLRPRSKSVRVE